MKPIILFAIAVSLSVIIILLALIVLDDIRQEETERQAIEYLNELALQQEREQILYEVDVAEYERQKKALIEGYRHEHSAICRDAYSIHGELNIFQKCLDYVDDNVWYLENDLEIPGYTQDCTGLPTGYLGCP